MEDVNKALADAEKEYERIAMQAEQERAMAEVMPYRFNQNMIAFRKFLPNVAATFESYSPAKRFRFFCTENGIPNLEWLDKNVAIYGANPFTECKEQVNDILTYDKFTTLDFGVENNPVGFVHVDYLNKLAECNLKAREKLSPITKKPDAVPLLLMFGVGLGYQLGYLYESCRISNLFLFEPDLDLFYASLFCFDWYALLEHLNNENLGLHIFLGQDEKNIMSDLIAAIHKRGAFLISNSLLCYHYPSSEIFSLIEQIKKEFYLLAMGWGFYDDNIIALSHCAANLNKKIPFLLKEKKNNFDLNVTPVFVIANGPSLDRAMNVIRCNKDKAIFISCGSAISALYRVGIKPDIHVETERTKAVPDFLDLIGDKDYLKDILFIGTDVIHPKCMDFFTKAGVCFKFDEPSALLCSVNFPDSQKFASLSGTNPLVANIGLKMACVLGFKKIYLFGVDNGYKDRTHHHSRHSAYFDENGNNIEKLVDMVISNSSYLVPANFGGEISTTAMFDTSRRTLASTAAEYSDAEIFNCSDGAYISDCIPLEPELLSLSNDVAINKKNMINDLYEAFFDELDISIYDMKKYLNIEFFGDLIDRLILEWDQPVLFRWQVIDLMLKQYSYMAVIANSYQSHIYKMLIGSLNYVFSLVGSSLFRYEDDDETLKIVRDQILIMQDYFRMMKSMYPNALESVDVVDNCIMKLFHNTTPLSLPK